MYFIFFVVAVCISYIVSCHNYMHYICETSKMLSSAGTLCTPQNSTIQKLSIIIIIKLKASFGQDGTIQQCLALAHSLLCF